MGEHDFTDRGSAKRRAETDGQGATKVRPEPAPPRLRLRRRRGRRSRLKSWIRDHKALSVLVATALTLLLVVVGWLVYLNSQLDDVSRFDLDLDRPDRPVRVAGEAMNILLLGVDDPDYRDDVGPQLAEAVEGQWEAGAFRSDTMMVLHLSASRRQAQLVSIPRDSWVRVPGHGEAKINAALSIGGPDLAAKTVENTFGIHLDHVVLLDFQGFQEATEILDGVQVYVPETVTDTMSGHTWDRGMHHIKGDDALLYVRQRYGLPNGDFDRIERQQNFLRAVLDQIHEKDTVLNPVRLTSLARNLSDLVAVDTSLTNAELRRLALSLRGLRSSAIRFLTVPNSGSGMVGEASVVKLRLKTARSMFAQMELDRFEGWYADHEVDVLSDRTDVS